MNSVSRWAGLRVRFGSVSLFLFSLAGCASTALSGTGTQAASTTAPQITPPPATQPTAQSSSGQTSTSQLSEQTPQQVAMQNFKEARDNCHQQYPARKGNMQLLNACVDNAREQYMFPVAPNSVITTVKQFAAYRAEAGALVDQGKLSVNQYNDYLAKNNNILTRQLQEDEDYDDRHGPGAMNNMVAYDETNRGLTAEDEHYLEEQKLLDQQKVFSDDKDAYEYCISLYPNNENNCADQKIEMQSDLAIYQTMAASIPPLQETQQNAAPSAPSIDNPIPLILIDP